MCDTICMHMYLVRGNKVYEPPRFMSASDAANQLLEIIKRRENDGQPLKGNYCWYVQLVRTSCRIDCRCKMCGTGKDRF